MKPRLLISAALTTVVFGMNVGICGGARNLQTAATPEAALNRIARIFVAGLLALLPIVVTLAVVAIIAQFLREWAGPSSLLGRLLISIGLNVATSWALAYVLGTLFILACIFMLGLLVESRLRPWIMGGIDWFFRRIPLVSNLYDMSQRFVAIVDRSGGKDNLKSMRPVWCSFGGDGGATVLALMPSAEPFMIGADEYLAVLIPTAPVPFGGCLIYVPSAWIKPAAGGVEHLMNVYVSMGVTPPQPLPVTADARLPETKKS